MRAGTHFTETQRFSQWWLWLLLLFLHGLFAVALWRRFAHPITVAEPDRLPWDILLPWLALGAITAGFLRTRLVTRVDAEGVRARFAPWQRKGRVVPWSMVQSCRVRRYRPLVDFGGWGWRRSLNGRLEGFTTHGDQALDLDLGERRSLLIGTQRPEALQAALRALGRAD